MSATLDEKVELMKRELDALQIFVTAKSNPWYKNVSTILSIVALIFSFSTTYISYRRTEVQDIQSMRQDLRGLLQRLAALPRELTENTIRYKNDLAALNMIGGQINQENTLIVRQASEIAKNLPPNLITSTEYYSIGVALQQSYDLAGAEEFLQYAIASAKDFNTHIAALRGLANIKFLQGTPEGGRIEYQKALDIFSTYPGYDPFTRADTHMRSELSWAFSEANSGNFNLALQHLKSAKDVVNNLPPSPGAQNLLAQVAQVEVQLTGSGGMAPAASLPTIPIP